jgi:hypothetical protein
VIDCTVIKKQYNEFIYQTDIITVGKTHCRFYFILMDRIGCIIHPVLFLCEDQTTLSVPKFLFRNGSQIALEAGLYCKPGKFSSPSKGKEERSRGCQDSVRMCRSVTLSETKTHSTYSSHLIAMRKGALDQFFCSVSIYHTKLLYTARGGEHRAQENRWEQYYSARKDGLHYWVRIFLSVDCTAFRALHFLYGKGTLR